LTANGVATATLVITLTDRTLNPVHNARVNLSAVGGSVSPSVVTTTVGYARSVFRAGTVARPATVTATTGALTRTTTIDLRPGPPAYLVLRVQPDVLTANGIATATLSITVTDAFANLAADDTPVNLTTTLGSLNPAVARTQGGVARSTLRAGTRSGTAVITATAGPAQASTTATFRSGPPASVAVSLDPRRLTADGVSTSTVTVQVTDQYANLVRDGTPVLFNASRGRIDPGPVLTRDGLARSIYIADTHAGRAIILATAGTVDGAASVDLLPGPPFSITLAADPPALTVGPGQAILHGRVSDRFDNAVDDGTVISLTATLVSVRESGNQGIRESGNQPGLPWEGEGGGPALRSRSPERSEGEVEGVGVTSPVTTTDGEFQAVLTAGTQSGTARVAARSGAANAHLDVPIRPGPAEWVGLAVSPAELMANGVATATLTITATDQYTNPVADGTPVSLAASGGTVVPANTPIRAGQASSTFHAGTVAGTATVTATVEGRSAVTTIRLVPGAPVSVTVQVEPAGLPVGQNATAAVRIQVTDRHANPVADGTPVSATTTLGTLVMAAPVTRGGLVTGTLIAGDVAGRALVTAQAGSATGQAEVTFWPGPPARIDLTANPNRVPADGESVAHLVARVTDAPGNRVADGVIVQFLTTLGTFEDGRPSYVTTTRDGQAEADLRAPVTLGRATVTARTNEVASAVDVEFVTGPPFTVTLAAAPDRLPADGVSTAMLTATVRDRQNRLVEDGTLVVFETDHGRLGAGQKAEGRTQNADRRWQIADGGRWQTSAISHSLSAIRYQLSAISYQLSAICCLLPTEWGQVITVTTSGGVATATLTAADRPARARVRATAGLKSAETQVVFIGKLFMPAIFKQSRLAAADMPAVWGRR
jgi:adhesin/invasin